MCMVWHVVLRFGTTCPASFSCAMPCCAMPYHTLLWCGVFQRCQVWWKVSFRYSRYYRVPCSIWTIDLAHLLRRFGADVAMTTTVVGANPEFSSEAFYAENLPEDERRVHQLFLVRLKPSRRQVPHSSGILGAHTSCTLNLL